MSSVDSNPIILPSPLIEAFRLMPSSVVFVIRRSPPDCVSPDRQKVRQSDTNEAKSSATGRVRRMGVKRQEFLRGAILQFFLSITMKKVVHIASG